MVRFVPVIKTHLSADRMFNFHIFTLGFQGSLASILQLITHMYQFQNIQLLPVFAVVPVLVFLFILVIRWKKNTTKKIGDAVLVNQLIKGYSARKFAVKFVFAILALSAIITGILNLQKPGTMENIERKGVDVMIALDVSKSMIATDLAPSRL